ncbi:hypothetical protein GN244_ATG06050 [Phytophthora infestans]|nr:hypothetical protein GN244_ATG06050 [Phytophthora infestans]
MEPMVTPVRPNRRRGRLRRDSRKHLYQKDTGEFLAPWHEELEELGAYVHKHLPELISQARRQSRSATYQSHASEEYEWR